MVGTSTHPQAAVGCASGCGSSACRGLKALGPVGFRGSICTEMCLRVESWFWHAEFFCRIAALRACGCSDFAILIASLQMVHYSRPETHGPEDISREAEL